MKYEFHVGDYVETKAGAKGYVIDVEKLWWKCCTCDIDGYGEGYDYSIIGVDDDRIADFFNRIGQYDFTKKDEGKIEKIDINKTGCVFMGREVAVFDTINNKINELVVAVNRLEEKVNEMA